MKIKKYLIALVDDDEDDRDILTATFRDNFEHVAVVVFHNAGDFVEQMELGGIVPDLIITDLYMPHMNGLELLLKIRDDARFAAVPIVLLSTIRNETVLKEVVEIRNVYYHVKPVGMADYTILAEKMVTLAHMGGGD